MNGRVLRSRLWKFCTVSALVGVVSISAGAGDKDMTAKIDAIFAGFRSNDAPGVAVLVVKGGKKVFERGYGVRDLRTKNRIAADTNFRLASVSKEFTAMAIMLLVHDHRLNYSDRLTEVFPGFPEYGKAITVRQLLTDTSGLLDYEDLMTKQFVNIPDEQIPQIHDAGVLELLKREKTTKFAPGTKWDYSNSAYCVLAMGGGESVGRAVQQLFKPAYFRAAQDGITRLRTKRERTRSRTGGMGTRRLTRAGKRRTRVRRLQHWAMEESTRHLTTWRNGTLRCATIHY